MNRSQELEILFDHLYSEYYTMVFQMCFGYSKADKETAQDLTQEAFLNIWKALGKFKNQSSYKTWVYRVTVNTCLMFIRNKKTLKTDEIDIGVYKTHATVEVEETPYIELYYAIGKLPEIDRLIMIMVLEELKYEMIAQVMGISLNNLRVKIHRIKSRIGNILNGKTNG